MRNSTVAFVVVLVALVAPAAAVESTTPAPAEFELELEQPQFGLEEPLLIYPTGLAGNAGLTIGLVLAGLGGEWECGGSHCCPKAGCPPPPPPPMLALEGPDELREPKLMFWAAAPAPAPSAEVCSL